MIVVCWVCLLAGPCSPAPSTGLIPKPPGDGLWSRKKSFAYQPRPRGVSPCRPRTGSGAESPGDELWSRKWDAMFAHQPRPQGVSPSSLAPPPCSSLLPRPVHGPCAQAARGRAAEQKEFIRSSAPSAGRVAKQKPPGDGLWSREWKAWHLSLTTSCLILG
jgi:hypothetical protein